MNRKPAYAKTEGKPTRFVFLLLPQYSATSFANALETLSIANRLSQDALFEWVICSENGEPVKDSLGAEFPIDQGLEECHRDDTIIICSGQNVHGNCSGATLQWLRRNSRMGVSAIAGLYTGAYIMAKAGLLEQKAATIHWEFQSSFVEEFPNIKHSEYTYSMDANRYTTASAIASFDLFLLLISEAQIPELGDLVAEQLVYSDIRTFQYNARTRHSDRVGLRHPKLSEILALMETNLEEPLRLDDMAKTVNISIRQLERLFRRYLGSSPNKYYTNMRLLRAQQLLLQTNMPIIDIAFSCGFNTSSHFSRLFKQKFSATPRNLRGEVR